MNPAKVRREAVRALTDLPNIGPACAKDLRLLGIEHPEQLVGRDAWDMYEALCRLTGVRHDPCVIDVFLSIIDFMQGGEARPWWQYTAQRKGERPRRCRGPASMLRGQHHRDAQAAAVAIEQGDAPAVGFDDFASECQAQPGTVALG